MLEVMCSEKPDGNLKIPEESCFNKADEVLDLEHVPDLVNVIINRGSETRCYELSTQLRQEKILFWRSQARIEDSEL